MLAALLADKPKVVSFHFGAPPPDRVRALRDAGIVLLGSATSVDEARMLVAAGVHAIVAQGYEAGGHRGVFDPDAPDDRLDTMALTRLLACQLDVPVIAAGGIMDGAGVSAALRLGASAVQLGTAFIACPESLADAGYRAALASEAANHTVMTRAISGRPARCLANRFTALALPFPLMRSQPTRLPMMLAKPSTPLASPSASRALVPSGPARERRSPAPCQRLTSWQPSPPK